MSDFDHDIFSATMKTKIPNIPPRVLAIRSFISAVIAKMAKVKIMPVVYSGPLHLKGLFAGERVDLNFGNPIDISDVKRINDEGIEEISNRIQTEFDRLDIENETYYTAKKLNPLTYIYRIPLALLAIVVIILTLIFSYIASFVWDPDKHRKLN